MRATPDRGRALELARKLARLVHDAGATSGERLAASRSLGRIRSRWGLTLDELQPETRADLRGLNWWRLVALDVVLRRHVGLEVDVQLSWRTRHALVRGRGHRPQLVAEDHEALCRALELGADAWERARDMSGSLRDLLSLPPEPGTREGWLCTATEALAAGLEERVSPAAPPPAPPAEVTRLAWTPRELELGHLMAGAPAALLEDRWVAAPEPPTPTPPDADDVPAREPYRLVPAAARWARAWRWA